MSEQKEAAIAAKEYCENTRFAAPLSISVESALYNIRFMAFMSGHASRDAEVAELKAEIERLNTKISNWEKRLYDQK